MSQLSMAIGLVVSVLARANAADWQRITPDGGGLSDLAQSPNPARLWGVSGMSIVRSDDRGDTWEEKAVFPESWSLQGVEADAGASDTAYVMGKQYAPGGGLVTHFRRTTDGGSTWTTVEEFGFTDSNDRIKSHPTVPGMIFRSQVAAVFRSTDGGETWPVGATTGGAYVWAIAPSASDPSTLYVSALGRLDFQDFSYGIYKSVDGGQSYVRVLFTDSTTALAVDPTDADIVYEGSRFGIYKTVDGGVTWDPVGAGIPGPTNNGPNVRSIAIDPTTTSIVYASVDDAVFKSVDGGLTFVPASVGLEVIAAPTNLAVDPTNTARLVAASIAGVARSDDAAATWTHHAAGIPDNAVTAIGIPPAAPSEIMLGSPARGAHRSTDGGESWQIANAGIEGLRTARVAVGSASTQAAFAAGTRVFSGNPHRLARTLDGGASWTLVPVPAVGDNVEDVAVAPSDGSVVYAVSNQNPPIRKSVDGGATWSSLAAPRTGRILVDPTDADVVYVVASYDVAKSVDGGDNWTTHQMFPPAFFERSAAIDPRNPSRLVVGVRGTPSSERSGVYLSNDAGVTWTRVDDRVTHQVAIHPVDGRIFAAFNDGVASSADYGATWLDLTGSLPLENSSLQALAATPTMLYATVRGAGLFRLEVVACEAQPATDCRTAIAPRAGRLRWKSVTPASASLRLTLGKLGAILGADLGEPATSEATVYGVCIYDRSGAGGTPRLVTKLTAPGGDDCSTPPCWRLRGNTLGYRDPARLPDGLAQLTVRSTAIDGKERFVAVGRGPLLDLPSSAVVPPVVAQIRRQDASVCWESTFATTIDRNDGITFRARSD